MAAPRAGATGAQVRPCEVVPAPGWGGGLGRYVDDLRPLASLGRTTVIIGLALVINLLFIANIWPGHCSGPARSLQWPRLSPPAQPDTPIHVTSQDDGATAASHVHLATPTRATPRTVREATDQLAGASQQIASGNSDLSSRTEATAANPGTDRRQHGRADRLRHPKRLELRAGPRMRTHRQRRGRQRWRGCAQVVNTMNGISASSPPHLRHHRRDRRHRLPDQHPALNAAVGSRPRGRTKAAALRGGRWRPAAWSSAAQKPPRKPRV